MSARAAQDLLSILRELQAGKKPYSRNSGICYHVTRTVETTLEEISDVEDVLIQALRAVCGGIGYVVQHPEMTAEQAYIYTDDHWDRSTEYGRNRWKLVDDLITWLETST